MGRNDGERQVPPHERPFARAAGPRPVNACFAQRDTVVNARFEFLIPISFSLQDR